MQDQHDVPFSHDDSNVDGDQSGGVHSTSSPFVTLDFLGGGGGGGGGGGAVGVGLVSVGGGNLSGGLHGYRSMSLHHGDDDGSLPSAQQWSRSASAPIMSHQHDVMRSMHPNDSDSHGHGFGSTSALHSGAFTHPVQLAPTSSPSPTNKMRLSVGPPPFFGSSSSSGSKHSLALSSFSSSYSSTGDFEHGFDGYGKAGLVEIEPRFVGSFGSAGGDFDSDVDSVFPPAQSAPLARELRMAPAYIERFSSFVSTERPQLVLAAVSAVLTTNNVEHTHHEAKNKIKGTLYIVGVPCSFKVNVYRWDGSEGAREVGGTADRAMSTGGDEILVEFSRRAGCCVAFGSLYRTVLDGLAATADGARLVHRNLLVPCPQADGDSGDSLQALRAPPPAMHCLLADIDSGSSSFNGSTLDCGSVRNLFDMGSSAHFDVRKEGLQRMADLSNDAANRTALAEGTTSTSSTTSTTTETEESSFALSPRSFLVGGSKKTKCGPPPSLFATASKKLRVDNTTATTATTSTSTPTATPTSEQKLHGIAALLRPAVACGDEETERCCALLLSNLAATGPTRPAVSCPRVVGACFDLLARFNEEAKASLAGSSSNPWSTSSNNNSSNKTNGNPTVPPLSAMSCDTRRRLLAFVADLSGDEAAVAAVGLQQPKYVDTLQQCVPHCRNDRISQLSLTATLQRIAI